jgi:hypothetical protein
MHGRVFNGTMEARGRDPLSPTEILFQEKRGERAKEIDVPRRTLARKADEFEKLGMQSLFPSGEQGGARETSKTLPEEIRQLIVDLHSEMPNMSWREIAEVCYIRYGRQPDHKSVKHIATSGPPPSLQARRYQPWHQIADPAERKLAVIRLHFEEGWSITSIAAYLDVSRPTIYATLQRWAEDSNAHVPLEDLCFFSLNFAGEPQNPGIQRKENGNS